MPLFAAGGDSSHVEACASHRTTGIYAQQRKSWIRKNPFVEKVCTSGALRKAARILVRR